MFKNAIAILALVVLAACGGKEIPRTCSTDNDCTFKGETCNLKTNMCEMPMTPPMGGSAMCDVDCGSGRHCEVVNGSKKCVDNVPMGGNDCTMTGCPSGQTCDAAGTKQCKPNNPNPPQGGPTRTIRIKFEVAKLTAAGNVGRRVCYGSPATSGSRLWNGPFSPWTTGNTDWVSFGNDLLNTRNTYYIDVTFPATNAGKTNGLRAQCYDINSQVNGPDITTYGIDPRGDSVTFYEVTKSNGQDVVTPLSFVRVSNNDQGKEGVNAQVD